MRNFERDFQWLEEERDRELYALAEIHSKMEDLARAVYGIPNSI